MFDPQLLIASGQTILLVLFQIFKKTSLVVKMADTEVIENCQWG